MHIKIGDRRIRYPAFLEDAVYGDMGRKKEFRSFLAEVMAAYRKEVEIKHAMPDFFADMFKKGFKGES